MKSHQGHINAHTNCHRSTHMHTEAAPSSSGLTNGLCHICHEFVHVRKWCAQPLTDAFTQDILTISTWFRGSYLSFSLCFNYGMKQLDT